MKPNTLIELLENQAREIPDSIAFTYNEKPTTYGEMWGGINRVGAYLIELGVKQGDRVIMVLSNSEEFFAAFYGVQRVGGIAVPLFPGSGPERVISIALSSGSKVVVLPGSIPEDQLAGFKLKGKEYGLVVTTVLEGQDASIEVRFPEIRPEDGAFIQYTSGSTGNPKGVLLTHDNLLTNVVQMIKGMQITEEDIFISWLPVYHDMGLILMTMAPFYLGIAVHLLPTQLQDMRAWLEAIQDHRGTFTAAPDFAYRLCLRRVDPADYDIRSLRVALNAAEPVRSQTIHEFEESFGLENVMVAGYGLAEATVGVSMWPPQTAARVDERGFVSVGPPFPGVKLKIINEEQPIPPGEVGEIAICSEANSSGYSWRMATC
jgi:acyl-CoA synthetase (AMP-forming)/AMP-acid ligase II